eukprot:gene26005-11699_t
MQGSGLSRDQDIGKGADVSVLQRNPLSGDGGHVRKLQQPPAAATHTQTCSHDTHVCDGGMFDSFSTTRAAITPPARMARTSVEEGKETLVALMSFTESQAMQFARASRVLGVVLAKQYKVVVG